VTTPPAAAGASDQHQNSLATLPFEILAKIFRFLDFPTLVVVLPSVCTSLFHAVRDALVEDRDVWSALRLKRGLAGFSVFWPLVANPSLGAAGVGRWDDEANVGNFSRKLRVLELIEETTPASLEPLSPVYVRDVSMLFDCCPGLRELVIAGGQIDFFRPITELNVIHILFTKRKLLFTKHKFMFTKRKFHVVFTFSLLNVVCFLFHKTYGTPLSPKLGLKRLFLGSFFLNLSGNACRN
jgi:hypothetical protein